MDEVEKKIEKVRNLINKKLVSCKNLQIRRFIVNRLVQVENIKDTYSAIDSNLIKLAGIKENFLSSLDEIEDFVNNLNC